MRFSKKVEYALIAILHIARKEEGELTTARELSAEYNIPPEVLGKVMQRLARKKLIQSVQGIRGGYRLKMPIDRVNLSQIVDAIDGPIRIVSCVEKTDHRGCRQISYCNIKNPMALIQLKMESFLGQITLKDLEQKLLKSGNRASSVTSQS